MRASSMGFCPSPERWRARVAVRTCRCAQAPLLSSPQGEFSCRQRQRVSVLQSCSPRRAPAQRPTRARRRARARGVRGELLPNDQWKCGGVQVRARATSCVCARGHGELRPDGQRAVPCGCAREVACGGTRSGRDCERTGSGGSPWIGVVSPQLFSLVSCRLDASEDVISHRGNDFLRDNSSATSANYPKCSVGTALGKLRIYMCNKTCNNYIPYQL
jgi:hypothetical protein